MCERICKTCGGDDEIAKIAEAMGHRPDIAFAKMRRMRMAIETLQAYNNLRTDTDMYLYDIAEWGLGRRAAMPLQEEFGL